MKKNITLITGAGLLLVLGILGVIVLKAPGKAVQTTRYALQIMGLHTSYLQQPELKWGQLRFQEVPLDKDSISTVKAVAAAYNPLSILFSDHMNLLVIDHLSLIGEWNAQGPNFLSISGWKIPKDMQILSSLPASRLRLNKADLSVLTPDFGGVNLSLDMEGDIHDQKLEFQSHFTSAQPGFSFSGGANGTIAHDYTNIDIDMEDGKFELPGAVIRATRMHGWVNYSRDKSGAVKLMSELRAGGFSTLDLPWGNSSVTIEAQNGTIKAFSEAKSIGIEGMELNLSYEKTLGSPAVISGTIQGDDGGKLTEYLSSQTKFKIPPEDLAVIRKSETPMIDFVFDPAGKKIKYRVGMDQNSPAREIPVQ